MLLLLAAPSTLHAAAPKACDLLTAQAAAPILGGPVSAPTDMQGIVCGYNAKSGSGTVGLTVVESGLTCDQFAPTIPMAAAGGNKVEQIPGLGECNTLVALLSGKTTMTVVYHKHTVTLSVGKKLTPELKAQIIDLAKQILPKL